MMTGTDNEKFQRLKIFCEFVLKRDIKGSDNFYDTIFEALEYLTSELLEKTKRANCNCINHDEFEELNEAEKELITLRKMMKWEVW